MTETALPGSQKEVTVPFYQQVHFVIQKPQNVRVAQAMAVLAAGTVLMMAALLLGKAGLVSTSQQLLSATDFVFKERAARLQTKQVQNATAAHQQIQQNARTVVADKKVVNV